LANYRLGFKELTNGGYNIQANQLFQSQSELYSGFIWIDVWNKLHYLGKRLSNTVVILYCCLKAEEINARSFILVTQHSNLGSDSWFIEGKPFFVCIPGFKRKNRSWD